MLPKAGSAERKATINVRRRCMCRMSLSKRPMRTIFKQRSVAGLMGSSDTSRPSSIAMSTMEVATSVKSKTFQ